jgi:hypothetical protein
MGLKTGLVIVVIIFQGLYNYKGEPHGNGGGGASQCNPFVFGLMVAVQTLMALNVDTLLWALIRVELCRCKRSVFREEMGYTKTDPLSEPIV